MTRWIAIIAACASFAASIIGARVTDPTAITAWSIAAGTAMAALFGLWYAAVRRHPVRLIVGGPLLALLAVIVRWQVEHPVAVTACTVAAAMGALGPLGALLTRRAPDDQGGDQ